jgi:hypothetical protein
MFRYIGAYLAATLLAAGLLSASPAQARAARVVHRHRRHVWHAPSGWAYGYHANRTRRYTYAPPYGWAYGHRANRASLRRHRVASNRYWNGNRVAVYRTYTPGRVYVSRVAGYRSVYRRRHRHHR